MRDFPRDVVCRNILARMLGQQHYHEKAEAVLAEAEAIAPHDPYVQKLVKYIRKQEGPPAECDTEHVLPMPFYLQARTGLLGEEVNGSVDDESAAQQPDEKLGIESAGGGEHQDGQHPRPELTGMAPESAARAEHPHEPTEEQEPHATTAQAKSGPRTMAFLSRLTEQVPWIEGYFTGPIKVGVHAAAKDLERHIESGTSDLALVAAHRAGLLQDQESRKRLEIWVRARPSSYSARLLLAWQGPNGEGLDQAAMASIAKEFPENRRWNDWLRFGSLPKESRDALCGDLRRSRNAHDKSLWDGRLEAVYPNLKSEEDEVTCNLVPMKRLVEDIAFAGAERAVPSIAIT